MSMQWEYPVYLIQYGGGYVSVVGSGPGADEAQMLAVFTQQQAAVDFMHTCDVPGEPRALENAREFGWLLQSLRRPVTRVAFDPEPGQKDVQARWIVDVHSLLQDHLVMDMSPWNYPVFVIAQEAGFACIMGEANDVRQWTALCLFTTAEKARAYLELVEEDGTIQSLADRQQTRELLIELADSASAVALDPVVKAEQRSAQYCFSIQTLLEKYLVTRVNDPRGEDP